MKKVMFAVAAMAMIAFAGCKKESNTITLGVGMEQPQNSAKEGWYNNGNQVAFQSGDKAYIVCEDANHNITSEGEYFLNLQSDVLDPTDGYSRWANVVLPNGCLDIPAVMYYPNAIMEVDDNYEHHIMTALNNEPTMAIANDPEHEFQSLTTVTSEWPLVAYLPSVQNGAVFSLKNTTALIAPAVKIGPNFIESLNTRLGTNYTGAVEVKITKVTLNSTVPLAGIGYIENPYSAADEDVACKFRVDENIESYNQVVATASDDAPWFGLNGDRLQIAGYIGTPEYTEGQLTSVVVEFSLRENNEVRNFVYTTPGPLTIGRDITLKRNERTTLVLDLYSARGNNDAWWNRLMML